MMEVEGFFCQGAATMGYREKIHAERCTRFLCLLQVQFPRGGSALHSFHFARFRSSLERPRWNTVLMSWLKPSRRNNLRRTLPYSALKNPFPKSIYAGFPVRLGVDP